jgi:hypothetical protein
MKTKSEGRTKESLMTWGSIVTVLILTGICVLSLLLNYQSATASEMLPVSIQAKKMADYSADQHSQSNPVVNLEIIEAAIKDQEPTNVDARLENVLTNLQTGVPTVTPTSVSTSTPLPGGGEPGSSGATQTNPLLPTSTPRPPNSATPGENTQPSGYTATVSKTGTIPPTDIPTDTPEKTATATEVGQATATTTNKPTDTATNPPTATTTATKIPPTATKTATKAPTKKPPTATNTATRTPTKVPPTATMAPTTACSRPGMYTGFVEYTYPRDGAVGVPRDVIVIIQFNQPMYEGDLFKNIKVSGTNVNYVMRYDPGTHRVEIDFQGLLKPGAKITIEVKRNVKNICMWRQVVSVDFKFTITKN